MACYPFRARAETGFGVWDIEDQLDNHSVEVLGPATTAIGIDQGDESWLCLQ